jgi:predicted ABC-type transport system involved in lysophospholipase L1 biosynthesis ATPase subunit
VQIDGGEPGKNQQGHVDLVRQNNCAAGRPDDAHRKSPGNGTPAVIDFNPIDFNPKVSTGGYVAGSAPSGRGKAPALRMIAGFQTVSESDVFGRGKPATNVPAQRLVAEPEILPRDEPLGARDVDSRNSIQNELDPLQRHLAVMLIAVIMRSPTAAVTPNAGRAGRRNR